MAGNPSSSHGTSGGSEIGYTQIVANVNVTDTAEGTATALITSSALTFSGAAAIAEFFTPSALGPTGGFMVFSLWEGATQIGRLVEMGGISGGQAQMAICARYRFTPTAGTHTYKVAGWVASTTGTPLIKAGSGGTGADVPAYLRFVYV